LYFRDIPRISSQASKITSKETFIVILSKVTIAKQAEVQQGSQAR
jgi:hypothetical protein